MLFKVHAGCACSVRPVFFSSCFCFADFTSKSNCSLRIHLNRFLPFPTL
jgi:hypothetical protein